MILDLLNQRKFKNNYKQFQYLNFFPVLINSLIPYNTLIKHPWNLNQKLFKNIHMLFYKSKSSYFRNAYAGALS